MFASLVLLLLQNSGAIVPPGEDVLAQEPNHQQLQEKAKKWWSSLSEEERHEVLARQRRLKEMSADARNELNRRTRALKEVGERVLARLTPEQHARYDALSPEQQHEELRRIMHGMMRGHEENLRRHGPPPSRKLSVDQRLQCARRFIERHRGDSLQIKYDKMVSDGWISSAVSAALLDEPMEIKLEAMHEATKWRTWSHATSSGWFSEWQLKENQRIQLGMLPSAEFMRAVSLMRAGEGFDSAIRHNGKGNDANLRRPDDSRRPPRMGPSRF